MNTQYKIVLEVQCYKNCIKSLHRLFSRYHLSSFKHNIIIIYKQLNIDKFNEILTQLI